MSHPKLVFVLATTLILISLLGRAVPSTSAAPGRSGLETREQEQIDAYIQARMQAAHIPGLALGVVRGNQITRAGGTAMPQRYGIRVKGLLDLSWLAWFDSLTITHEASGETLLVGLLLDQAAFYGVLGKARKLNLQLVFVGEIPANTPDDGHPTTG